MADTIKLVVVIATVDDEKIGLGELVLEQHWGWGMVLSRLASLLWDMVRKYKRILFDHGYQLYDLGVLEEDV